jgi:FkbM family methyltransferase
VSDTLVYKIYDVLIYAPKGRVPKGVRNQIASGLYEQDEVQMLPTVLDPTLPLVELGAGIGVVSCIANRMLKDPTAHVAVEMHPDVLGILEVNRAMNMSRFEILPMALTYEDDHRRDSPLRPWTPSERLLPGGEPTAGRLSDIVDGRDWPQFNLVMDIEGMELQVIERELELVRDRVASISVELHPHVLGVDGAAAVVRLILSTGLQLAAVGEGSVLGFRRD